MLEKMKIEVLQANLAIVSNNLVLLSWGNVSCFDRDSGYVVIKPSGVDYAKLEPEDMSVVDMEGNAIEGSYKPSSDTPTHLEIYKSFKYVNAVVHTHSKWATSFSQAGCGIPCKGTTHADHFHGDIPCTRSMSREEIGNDYEKNTGKVIIETFFQQKIDPLQVGAVIVAGHGPFSWGKTLKAAVENSVVMEYAAEMAYISGNLNPAYSISRDLLDKHYFRKHGAGAYYGQG